MGMYDIMRSWLGGSWGVRGIIYALKGEVIWGHQECLKQMVASVCKILAGAFQILGPHFCDPTNKWYPGQDVPVTSRELLIFDGKLVQQNAISNINYPSFGTNGDQFNLFDPEVGVCCLSMVVISHGIHQVTMKSTTMNRDQPPSFIINHYQPSSATINHHSSAPRWTWHTTWNPWD